MDATKKEKTYRSIGRFFLWLFLGTYVIHIVYIILGSGGFRNFLGAMKTVEGFLWIAGVFIMFIWGNFLLWIAALFLWRADKNKDASKRSPWGYFLIVVLIIIGFVLWQAYNDLKMRRSSRVPYEENLLFK